MPQFLIQYLTQSEYKALLRPDSNTLYLVAPDLTSQKQMIGWLRSALKEPAITRKNPSDDADLDLPTRDDFDALETMIRALQKQVGEGAGIRFDTLRERFVALEESVRNLENRKIEIRAIPVATADSQE